MQPAKMLLTMSLPFNAPAGSCYDFFLVGYDNTGTQVVNEPIGSLCAGGIPPLTTGWGGGGGTTGGGGEGPQQVTTINQSGLKPCQKAVLQRLQAISGTAVLDIVALFSGVGPNYNWIVKDDSLSAGLFGNTVGPYDRTNRTVTTTFDSNQWRDATDLSIARTMLHESVHAYLLTYFANNPSLINATYLQMVTNWNSQMLAGTAPSTALGIVHHTEMGQSWIGDIAWSLKQYGIRQGYNLPDLFYRDMAWGGLEATPEFLALSPADKQRIHDTIVRELTGKDSQGNNVSQSGTKSGC